MNWLSLVVKRGEEWIEEATQEEEKDLRSEIVDQAAGLIAHLSATSGKLIQPFFNIAYSSESASYEAVTKGGGGEVDHDDTIVPRCGELTNSCFLFAEGGAILRPLLLPTCLAETEPQTEPLMITLNDALPSHLDPTSVGLQSWGSSIILARMIALDPIKFGVNVPNQRILELGAGTGLLSLVWKAMSERMENPCDVIATDSHPTVLSNLERNIISNSAAVSPAGSPLVSPSLKPVNNPPKTSGLSSPSNPSTPRSGGSSSSTTSSSSLPVQAHKLDWSAVHSSRAFSAATNPRNPIPTIMPPPFDKPFHTLIAADVVYGPTHSTWLRSCVEQFLIKPDAPHEVLESQAHLSKEIASLSLEPSTTSLPSRPSLHSTDTSAALEDDSATHTAKTTTSGSDTSPSSPAFHLIVPLRPTHAEAIASIDKVFPSKESLPTRQHGEPWRVAIQSTTEIERVKGVGRADEGSYKLFRIGWC